MTNSEIASRLQQYARELRERHENMFRVKAYRRAAEKLMRLETPIEEILRNRGRAALAEIPDIGRHLAETITIFVETGEWQVRH